MSFRNLYGQEVLFNIKENVWLHLKGSQYIINIYAQFKCPPNIIYEFYIEMKMEVSDSSTAILR